MYVCKLSLLEVASVALRSAYEIKQTRLKRIIIAYCFGRKQRSYEGKVWDRNRYLEKSCVFRSERNRETLLHILLNKISLVYYLISMNITTNALLSRLKVLLVFWRSTFG